MERKITDLVEDTLNYPDYDRRINFLLAGLLSADANDTPEKEQANIENLKEICKYCNNYDGDKGDYIKSIKEIITPYIEENERNRNN